MAPITINRLVSDEKEPVVMKINGVQYTGKALFYQDI